jgi:hypothetical protein
MRHANKIELCQRVGSLLDYVIDGRALAAHLHSRGHEAIDFVSPFGTTSREFESRVASWLLLRASPPLPTGRIPLMFCPRCGDLGCGAVSAVIERADGCFFWKDFGFESPTSDSVELKRYEHVRGFIFSEHDYTETFGRYFAHC